MVVAVAVAVVVVVVVIVVVVVAVAVVVVVVVVVWDAENCACMYTPHRACRSFLAICQRAGLETWACAAQASANPCPVMTRNTILILLIQTPPLVASKSSHKMTHMTQPLPHPWTRMSS